MKTMTTPDKRILVTIHRSPATKFEDFLYSDITTSIQWATSIHSWYMNMKRTMNERASGSFQWRAVPTRIELQECAEGLERFQLIREHKITSKGMILERVEDDLFVTVEMNPEVIGITPTYTKSMEQ